jgi:hypothetical protein
MADERVTFDLSQQADGTQSQSGRPRSRTRMQPRGDGNTTSRIDKKDKEPLDYSYTEREPSLIGESLLAKSREMIVSLREELVKSKEMNHLLEHKNAELIEEAQQAVREKIRVTQQFEKLRTSVIQKEQSLKHYSNLCADYSNKVHSLQTEISMMNQKLQEITFGTQSLQVVIY